MTRSDLPYMLRNMQVKLAQYRHAAQVVRDERLAQVAAERRAEAATEAQAIVQEVACEVQQRVHERIAGLVTHCLKSVFGSEGYEFKLVIEEKRGKTECRPVFLRDGQEVHPLRGAGGGAADVAAFALRLVCLLMSRPRKRRLLVLDEPFRFLSAEYIDAARQLLEELSAKMDVQFVIVTHCEELKTGKVVGMS